MEYKFLQILKVLTKDNKLTRTDICVMAVLATYAYFPNYCKGDNIIEMSITEIHNAFETIPTRTIQRSIKHLAELGYIEPIRTKGKKSRYEILIDLPKGQPKQIHKTNKIQSEGDYIEEVKRAALANPFLNGGKK